MKIELDTGVSRWTGGLSTRKLFFVAMDIYWEIKISVCPKSNVFIITVTCFVEPKSGALSAPL